MASPKRANMKNPHRLAPKFKAERVVARLEWQAAKREARLARRREAHTGHVSELDPTTGEQHADQAI